MHASLQQTRGDWQKSEHAWTTSSAQRPFLQIIPSGHALPQVPQFFGSETVSAQTKPQHSSPKEHPPQASVTAWQLPLLQVSLMPHVMPHPPQFCGSEDVSRQL